jgi:hypothetical protein
MVGGETAMKTQVRCAALVFLVLGMVNCDKDRISQTSDVTPPDPTTLQLVHSAHDSLTLSWVATGDDGLVGRASAYDLRVSVDSLAEANWDAARAIPDLPVPKMPGETESTTVTGLRGGVWHLGLRTGDEVPNWSAISNIVSATVQDTVPPARVMDLEATAVTAASVTLEWTAPLDDSELRRAVLYQMRYSTDEITTATWGAGIPVENLPVPGQRGSPERMTITGLETGTIYYFALRSVDWASNVSPLSNVAHAETRELRQLTSDAHSWGGAHFPDWSPDGEHIVYATNWDPSSSLDQIYVVPSGGGSRIRITNGSGGGTQPCWSPDGERIAFVSYREVAPETWQELSIVEPWAGSEAEVVASHGAHRVRCPAWSPSGDRIAYVVQENAIGEPPVYSMYSVGTSGSEPSRIYRINATVGGLSWSPNGEVIAFHLRSPETFELDIWTIPADGGLTTRLTTDYGNERKPAWSPDGLRIAYSSDRTGSSEIWTMDARGGDRQQITSNPTASGGATDPSWSPDQDALAVTLSEDGRSYDIWIMYLD